ncbi:hypothetical protein GJ496_000194 [Pomphorhynchus laevis]|nr:hypothetical protein GJ496_000194 [Pomphorhynchus laevis]
MAIIPATNNGRTNVASISFKSGLQASSVESCLVCGLETLGLGITKEAETTLHCLSPFIRGRLSSGRGLVKLDFTDDFNSIHRREMFKEVRILKPGLFRYAHLCYG